jgi:hypothetical protein
MNTRCTQMKGLWDKHTLITFYLRASHNIFSWNIQRF